MHYPITKLDRWGTFPVVLLIYGLSGYASFAYPETMKTVYLPFLAVALLSFISLLFVNLKSLYNSNRHGQTDLSPQASYFKPVLKWWVWLGTIWIGLLGIVIGAHLIQIVLTNFNPYVAKLYISNQAYWQSIYPYIQIDSWTYWGYFAALIFMAWWFAYLYYHKQGVPCLHRLAASLFERYLKYKKIPIWSKSFGEGHVHFVMMTWFGLLMLSAMVLLASGILTALNLPSYFTIPIISMSFFSLIFVFFASSFWIRNLTKINSLPLSLSTLTAILSIIIVGLLLLSGKSIQVILAHHPEVLKLVECDCTLSKLKLFIEARMQNVFFAVWILSLPIMITYVARISRGRSFFELAFAILGFALLLQMSAYFYTQENWLNAINWIYYPVVQLILGLGLLLGLCGCFFKKRTSWIFNNGLMQELPRKNEKGEDVYKVSEVSFLDGSKIRGMGMLTRKWTLMCIGLLLIHTLGGWQVVQLELSLVAFVIALLYFFAIIGIWIEIVSEK